MIETQLHDKGEFQNFLNTLHQHNLSFEDKVASEDSDDVLDTLMVEFEGSLEFEQIRTIKRAFDSEKVQVGNGYISILLPESMHDEASW